MCNPKLSRELLVNESWNIYIMEVQGTIRGETSRAPLQRLEIVLRYAHRAKRMNPHKNDFFLSSYSRNILKTLCPFKKVLQ